MSNSDSSQIELSREESLAIRRAIEERMHRLDRCRAVFDVEISEAHRALRGDHPEIPDRCRIVYQRAGEQAWQVTAYGEDDRILSDSVRDGAWIEAGGKCWHHRYSGYFGRLSHEELDVMSDEEEDRFEEQREARCSELRLLLWPLDLANEHLLSDLGFITEPFLRDTWRFSRDPELERLICRSRYNYEPTEFRFSTWEYLQWRVVRLWRPKIDIMEYYGKQSIPRTEVELILSEASGYLPEVLRTTDATVDTCPVETWEDPISFAGGLEVARTHRALRSSSDSEILRLSTLVPEESAFGANIPLSIRPMDRTKDLVDW